MSSRTLSREFFFTGSNTFFFIWLEGLAFFSANVGILAKLVRKHREAIDILDRKMVNNSSSS